MSNTFTTGLPVEDIHVLYKDTSNSENFQFFITETEKSGIHYKEAIENQDGEKASKANEVRWICGSEQKTESSCF